MKNFIDTLSTTNFRIFVSVMLSVILVLSILTAVLRGTQMQTEIVISLLTFVGGMLGIDVTQFVMKRKTEIVTPPQTTAENAVPQNTGEKGP